MKKRTRNMGRPAMALPGGLTPVQHEARRAKLRLSKRAYTARIGVSQATYSYKTKSKSKAVRQRAARRGPRTPAVAQAVTVRDAIRRLRQQIAELQAALAVLERLAGYRR